MFRYPLDCPIVNNVENQTNFNQIPLKLKNSLPVVTVTILYNDSYLVAIYGVFAILPGPRRDWRSILLQQEERREVYSSPPRYIIMEYSWLGTRCEIKNGLAY